MVDAENAMDEKKFKALAQELDAETIRNILLQINQFVPDSASVAFEFLERQKAGAFAGSKRNRSFSLDDLTSTGLVDGMSNQLGASCAAVSVGDLSASFGTVQMRSGSTTSRTSARSLSASDRLSTASVDVFGDKKQLKKLEKESLRFRKLQQKEEKKQLKAAAKLAKSKKRISSAGSEE